MINLDHINSVYLIGIGGIGMSALARYFNSKGCYVAGYDKTSTTLTDELRSEKIYVHFQDDLSQVPARIKESDKSSLLIIYTPAIPKAHKVFQYFSTDGYTIAKRSAVLGAITANAYTIAVAGTHGKTTTSSIIAHMLRQGGVNCTAFLGGIAKNFDSNFVAGTSSSEMKEVIVVEADEFDKSFMTLQPSIAVVTSMDADHLDIYENAEALAQTYRDFAGKIGELGALYYHSGLTLNSNAAHQFSYAIEHEADYRANNVRVEHHEYVFDVTTPTASYKKLSLGLPGRHNVENALVSIAVAEKLKLDEFAIRKGLASFTGVRRRFDIHFKSERTVYLDDYAHHPAELTACINSVKELYPNQKVTGIFQPHLYSRTRDFAKAFGESLSLLDEVILLEIYPARELPIEGISSSMLMQYITHDNKCVLSKEQVLDKIRSNTPEVLLTLGAGDIDELVNPIKQLLNTMHN